MEGSQRTLIVGREDDEGVVLGLQVVLVHDPPLDLSHLLGRGM